MFVPGKTDRQRAPFVTTWPCRQDDVTDPAAMLRAAEGMDAMIHLAAAVTDFPSSAARRSGPTARAPGRRSTQCRKAGVRRYLCASSINAFGTIYWRLSGKPSPYTSMPLTEAFEPVPRTPTA